MNSTTRGLTAFGVALALSVGIPAAAKAATLTNSGGTLTYTAAAGTRTWVTFSQSSPTTVSVGRNTVTGDNDPIITSTCTPAGPSSFDCLNVTSVVADAADGDDGLFAFGLQVPVAFTAGDGNDSVFGGDAADVLSGGANQDNVYGDAGADVLSGGSGDDGVNGGPGADLLSGDGGDDFLSTDTGADVVSGGSGIDTADVSSFLQEPPAASPVPVSVTLNATADDGVAGQGANIGDDVENLSGVSVYEPLVGATQFGPVSLTGNAGANDVSGSQSPDTLTGGAGSDRLFGYGGDDTLNTRDGFADAMSCGDGVDTAIVDTLDVVSDTCENVSTADVGNAGEDKPPTVAWTAPASAAKLPGSTASTLTASAADDKGVAQVQFMDDDTVVCTDTTAPYTCAYQPQGGDVGRNTLTATAFDALGQTASSVRKVVVSRFSAKTLSLKISPTKDTKAQYVFTATGALTRSATVSKALNCSGSVDVSVKAGSKTLSTKTVRLSKSCTYKATFSFSSRRGFASSGKLKLRAQFAGNATIAAKTSSTKTVSTK